MMNNNFNRSRRMRRLSNVGSLSTGTRKEMKEMFSSDSEGEEEFDVKSKENSLTTTPKGTGGNTLMSKEKTYWNTKVDGLKSVLARKDEEVERLKENHFTLKMEMKMLEQENRKMRNQQSHVSETRSKEMEQLRKQLESYKTKFVQAHRDYENLQEKVESIKFGAHQEAKRLEDVISELRMDLEQSERKNSVLRRELNDAQGKINVVSVSMDNQLNKIDSFRSIESGLKDQIKSARRELDAKEKEIEKLLLDLSEAHERNRVQSQHHMSEIAKLKDDAQQREEYLEAQVEALNSQCAGSMGHIETLKSELSLLESTQSKEKDTFAREQMDASAKINKMAAQIDSLSEELQQNQLQFLQKQQQYELECQTKEQEYKESLKQLQRKLNSAESKVKISQISIDQKMHQDNHLSELEMKFQESMNMVAEKDHEIADLKHRLELKTNQQQLSEEKRQCLASQNKALTNYILHGRQALRFATWYIYQLKSGLNTAKETHEKLSRIQDSRYLKEKQEYETSTRQQLDCMKRENSELTQKLNETQAELKSLMFDSEKLKQRFSETFQELEDTHVTEKEKLSLVHSSEVEQLKQSMKKLQNELQRQTILTSQHQHRGQDMETQLDAEKKAKMNLEVELNSKKEEIKRLEQHAAKVERIIEEKAVDIKTQVESQYVQALVEVQQERDDLQHRLQSAEQENCDIRKRLANLQEKRDQAEERILTLQQEKATTKQDFLLVKEENTKLQRSITELEQKLALSEQELRIMKSNLEENLKTTQTLQTECNRLRLVEHEKGIVEERLGKIENALRELQDENIHFQKTAMDKNGTIQGLEKELGEKQQTIAALEADLHANVQVVEQLETEKARLSSRVDDLEAEHAALVESLETSMMENTALTEKCDDQNTKSHSLLEQLNLLKAEQRNLQEAKATLEYTLSALQQEVSTQNETISQLEAVVNRLQFNTKWRMFFQLVMFHYHNRSKVLGQSLQRYKLRSCVFALMGTSLFHQVSKLRENEDNQSFISVEYNDDDHVCVECQVQHHISEQMVEKCNNLEKELSRERQRHTRLCDSLKSETKRSNDLLVKVSSLSSSQKAMENELEVSRNRVDSLLKALERKDKEIEARIKDLSRAKDEINGFEERSAIAKESTTFLNHQVVTLTNEIALVQSEVSGALQTLASSQKTVQEQSQQIVELRQELANANDVIAKQKERLRHQGKVTDRVQELSETTTNLKVQLHDAKNATKLETLQKQQLETKLASILNEVEILQNEFNNLKREHKQVTRNLSDMEVGLQEQKSRNMQLEKCIDTKNKQLARMKQVELENADLAVEAKRAREDAHRVKELTASCQELEDKLDDLERENATWRQNCALFVVRQMELKSKHDKLTQANARDRIELIQLREIDEMYHVLVQEHQELQSLHKELQGEHTELLARSSTQKQTIEEMEKKLQGLQETRHDLEQSKAKINDLNSLMETLEAEKIKMEQTLEEKCVAFDSLLEKLESEVSKTARLTHANDTLGTKLKFYLGTFQDALSLKSKQMDLKREMEADKKKTERLQSRMTKKMEQLKLRENELATSEDQLKNVTKELNRRAVELHKGEGMLQLQKSMIGSSKDAIQQIQSLGAKLHVQEQANEVLRTEFEKLKTVAAENSKQQQVSQSFEELKQDFNKLHKQYELIRHEKHLLAQIAEKLQNEANYSHNLIQISTTRVTK